jgi:Putative prokaryotic signal transducing protein
MSDGELLKLAAESAELSDDAWDALEEELDRRDLDLPETDRPPQSDSLEKRNLVVLKRFRDLPEAMLAQGKLASEGLQSYLGDDNTVRMDWLWSNFVGGVKVLVAAEDEDEATRILDEPIPEQIDFGDTTEYQQPRCPRCKSLDVNFEELYKPIAYGSLIVNFPIPLCRRGWICQTCRHSWEETPSEAEQQINGPIS